VHLIDELEQRANIEQSPFRAQLLREDIVRIRKLEELVRSTPELDACRRAARRLGWTTLDARTHELAVPLDRLVDLVRQSLSVPAGTCDGEIRDAWLELTRLRIESMVGCLSTRLPKPSDD
jgi:cell division FtsZ-interacting protein ZapD